MNCTTIQRRLLTMTEPGQPPSAIREHLESCAVCQEMQRRLLQVEAHIPHLPVPHSAGRTAFLQRFKAETTVWDRLHFRMRNLQRWQLITTALAASLMLFMLAWFLAPSDAPLAGRPSKQTSPDALLARLVQRNLKLAEKNVPRDQVEILAELAEDLRGQSQPLVYYGAGREGKDSLRDLADWYGQVVRMGVTRAGQLPQADRRPVLAPIIKQLTRACDDAEHLASELRGDDMSADHPLHSIAFAARNGKDQLDTLLRHEPAQALFPVERTFVLTPMQRAAFCRLQLAPSLFAAAAVVRADNPSPTAIGTDQAFRFMRNRKLYQALVDNCLRLAEQSDPVHRAACSTVVADRLAEDLQRATNDKDFSRASDLSRHLNALLVEAVAFNLDTANAEIPIGGLREPEMLQIGDHVKRLADQTEEKLGTVADKSEQWQKLSESIGKGRAAVYKALKGRGAY
jgi:hypothetical protein